MRFECDSCHAKYKISDAKVAGRVVRFPCRQCDNKILIDGRADDVTVPAGAAYGFDDITRRSDPAPFGVEPETARRRPVPPARRRHSSVPPRRPASVARRMSSSPAAASALVGQHPGLAPPLPSGTDAGPGPIASPQSDKKEWHVSINDVPIGPIRLEEMAHKVDAGAVSEYSLVWRDGFDEWRPLATVPELMSLLYERRSSGPPTRSKMSSMPPFVEAQTAIKETADPPSIPPGPPKPPVHSVGFGAGAPASSAGAGFLASSSAMDLSSSTAGSDFSSPGIGADFTPLASQFEPDVSLPSIPAVLANLEQMDAPAAPAMTPMLEPTSSPSPAALAGLANPLEEAAAAAAVQPKPAVETPRSGSSALVRVLLVAVAVFAAVAAVMVVDRWGDLIMERFLGPEAAVVQQPRKIALPVDLPKPGEEGEPVEAVGAVEEDAETADDASNELAEIADDSAAEPAKSVDAEAAGEPEKADEAEVEAATEPAEAAAAPAKPVPTKARRRARPRRAPKPAPAAEPGIKKLGGDSLSADERRLLDNFGSGKSAGVAKIDVSESGSTKSKRDPLDNKAVSATVTTNKPRLQRCYERAIRGQQSPTAVRMNVSINVAASGRVSSVAVAGSGPGGLKECMEASIRRWRFPVSSEGGPAKFPIVFSAN
ncbi:MAG: GYF domain-containing protein [Myxococcota bacterium]